MSTVALEIDTSAVNLTLDQWERVLRNPQIRDPAMQELGDYLVQSIVRKTRRGVDYTGKPFAEYSDIYAEYRVEHGRAETPVDLTFTGKMLNSLDSVVTGEGNILIYFNVAERGQIAWYHNANLAEDPRPRKKMPLRRFVDIDPNSPEWKRAGSVFAAAIARQLEGT